MITIKHWRNIAQTDGESTEVEVTFGAAVNDLLTLYANFEKPTVNSGNFSAVTRNGTGVGMQGLTEYKRSETVAANDPDSNLVVVADPARRRRSDEDYRKFDRLATLLKELTFAYQHPNDPESNLDHLRKVASYQAGGRPTIELTEESYSSYPAILEFTIQWLLGHELDELPRTPDEIAAALLALEQALDDSEVNYDDAYREALALSA